MELERKLGQLMIMGFPDTNLENQPYISSHIRDHGLGGVILYGRNIHNPRQLRKLCADLHALSPHPLIIGVDQEGGAVSRLSSTKDFPSSCGQSDLGMLNDPLSTAAAAQITAILLKSSGINLNFTPVVDLELNANNFLADAGRLFSHDPELVSLHAWEVIQAHQQQGILTCLKHFPGHGSSYEDSHYGCVDITETWQEIELLPYQTILSRGYHDLIMMGHMYHRIWDPDHPASLSPHIIEGLLRRDLEFSGAVITDDLDMEAMTQYSEPEELAVKALKAGVDVLLFANHDGKEEFFLKIVDSLVQAVKKGELSEERVDEAWNRVQALRKRIRQKQGFATDR
ncbi:MAG: glycoside hydrolase family 3 [Waddliaceae bacterium]|nr:glycoside hydrolase family 3 [Waddliaceae bacterium]